MGRGENIYLVPGWDSFLHFYAGIMSAILGYHLAGLFAIHCKNERVLNIIFAICLALSIALVWEFFEYGMDRLFNQDMQVDTIIHSITSYTLGEETGVLGYIPQIDSVLVNGSELVDGGYLDIGLIDTMTDTLMGALGAVVAVIAMAIDNGRHPLIRSTRTA